MSSEKTLKSVGPGGNAVVVAIAAGSRARTRLESMGIIPGVLVDVVANGGGPMLISVGEGRVMVERGIAEKVIVA
ncbi:FeoA family protein [Desulfovibrio sp. Huiquan2017]|uniref:FeoA family protein n=1 Tax=Desulfovibrio sp. Huiquan2017 TaxID=2816861 RepID=UPI001A933FEC|nr:FeoA family protein [Desulfovibrio sp. Huiquan2017]